MWPDNETERDFLNFSGVADTVAEIIVQANGRPISIGVSGAWGVGKTSMIKLIRRSLESRSNEEQPKFIFVEFNAWLYQGYDDARAALMDVITAKLLEEANNRNTAVDTVKELVKRVDWFRVGKLAAGSAFALSLGLPPVGLIGDLWTAITNMGDKGGTSQEDIVILEESATKLANGIAGIIKSKPDTSPPKEIQAIRDSFEKALKELGVKLVVLIDDLDRCLPVTTISTLEAIRLFLFLNNTAFVIAADDTMIKHAVRKHFGDVDEDQVINYFDKLIQVPIRVPPLGTQEVRAYLMLLYVETSELPEEVKETMRERVCKQLGQTWRGARVDRAFMATIYTDFPDEIIARFDSAERLAPIMTSSTKIAGNPRLIKRFLNALSIRISISRANGVNVDEAALVKMLLFERCGNPVAYAQLGAAINQDAEGKPRFLAKLEEEADSVQEPKLDQPWNDEFVKEWLALPPRLADMDLRGVLYVSREHAPVITPQDRLSSEAIEILSAILQQPDMAAELRDRFPRILPIEMAVIMDRLLEKAGLEQEWGTPAILEACLAVVAADPSQMPRLVAFLKQRPISQLTPAIIPKLSDQSWSGDVFDTWISTGVRGPVKKAIDEMRA